jgi:hypothetical protein
MIHVKPARPVQVVPLGLVLAVAVEYLDPVVLMVGDINPTVGIGANIMDEVEPDLDSRTGFRHREWQKCWRLIKPGQKCGAKLWWGEGYIA